MNPGSKYIIRFSDPSNTDVHGHYFDEGTELGDLSTLPLFFEHKACPVMKGTQIGRAVLKRDRIGVKAEAVFTLEGDLGEWVKRLYDLGYLGWSSGSTRDQVVYQDVEGVKRIARWIPDEASLTPTPAEPWLPQNPTFPAQPNSPFKMRPAIVVPPGVPDAPGKALAITWAGVQIKYYEARKAHLNQLLEANVNDTTANRPHRG